MSTETVEAVVDWVKKHRLLSGPLLVNWHAGEPLAPRTSFYRERIPLFDPLTADGTEVTHSLQTNATLITDSYCELFAEYGVHIGVSIDGPAFIHDSQAAPTGKPTHQLAMRGIAGSSDIGFPSMQFCVLGNLSLRHPDELYHFFVDSGIRLPCLQY